ncbi:MAG: polynucleotide adenylyltransferase, partial [Clostridia bacterium]|nr:polynucleotide adenylyltransferase [Clostridia bacterium]
MHHDTETKMTLPAPVIYVMEKLESAGYTAYAVGGCVRDHLMGRVPGDYDVTTSAKPEEMLEVFSLDRVVETGLKHGTVTIVKDGMNVETTTYRIDGTYDDGRHPDSVTFTDRLDDDLCRRDFTINAMAYNPVRGIVDLWNGREDLEKRSIRCVGCAKERFSEDGLRILRALRFASVLDFAPDEECAEGVRDLKHLLDKISRERIYVELTKLLNGVGAARILREFPEIIAHALPYLEENGVVRAADFIELDEVLVKSGYPKNPGLRYALLFASLDEKQAADAMNSLKPSRDEKNAVMTLVKKRGGGIGVNKY